MSDLFIRCLRHGESQANTNNFRTNLHTISLTPLGFEQAFRLANEIEAGEAPELIIVSNYLRTHETAAPMIARFPQAQVAQWDETREFTFLSPANYNNTTAIERRPYVTQYWQREDAQFVDGEGAESFDNFISRVNATISKLEELHGNGLRSIFLFGHGLFLAAMRHILIEGNPAVDMQAIYRLNGSIQNTKGYLAVFDGKAWNIKESLK